MINVLKRMYIPNKGNNKITELRTILQREDKTHNDERIRVWKSSDNKFKLLNRFHNIILLNRP
jgi:hypothetical protein